MCLVDPLIVKRLAMGQERSSELGVFMKSTLKH